MLLRARCRSAGKFKFVVDDCRGHSVVVDLPPELGGGDEGPMASELGLMALAGCAAQIFKFVAEKKRIPVRDLEVFAELEKPLGKRARGLKLKIVVDADAELGELRRVWEVGKSLYPVVVDIFERAGLEVEPQMEVGRRQ